MKVRDLRINGKNYFSCCLVVLYLILCLFLGLFLFYLQYLQVKVLKG